MAGIGEPRRLIMPHTGLYVLRRGRCALERFEFIVSGLDAFRDHAYPWRRPQAADATNPRTAEDSEKGCGLALTEHPDVILIDLEMPGTDRWEPLRTLKND